ncbi:hypothetical protein EBV26_05115 [bacterium]|nr:hypothetical protein [bacterium]
MTQSVADLINNIENGTLADAEEIFKGIMDVRAGNALDAYRQEVANNIFNGGDEESLDDEGLDDDNEDLDLEPEDSGEDDADV